MLKLCDLVVQVGCGKCLVKGGLPGCLGGGRRQRGGAGRGGGGVHSLCRATAGACCAGDEAESGGRIRLFGRCIGCRVASYVMAFH